MTEESYSSSQNYQPTQKKYTNENDFLKSLEMVSDIEAFNNFNIPRVAQLSQRSNQFNLRTIRYAENDINKMINSENYFTFTFNLKDKFGDHGLICVIILNKQINSTLFIDTWFMSCRVLKRGMERFVLNHLVSYAKNNNFKFLEGEYIETPKNKLVKDHYSGLGFEKKYNNWILNLSDFSKLETYIK
mgnify:FL=1